MAVPLVDKVSFTLTETRLLMLGAEVFVGFQFEGLFSEKFVGLPAPLPLCHLVALGLMSLVVVLMIAPMMLDLVVFHGHAAAETQHYATRIVEASLFPFAASLAVSFGVVASVMAGMVAWVLAGGTFLLAMILWYIYPARTRARLRPGVPQRPAAMPMRKPHDTPLSTRLRDILTEARIILPGAQALLGFQMMAFLSKAFDVLPSSSKQVHLAAVCLLLVSIVMLMSPPGYHRIVEDGEETERLHAFARKAVVGASIPFGLSLAADFYVAAALVTHRSGLAAGIAGAVLLFALWLWFGYPLWFRFRHPGAVR